MTKTELMIKITEELLDFFSNDTDKVTAWLQTPNQLLGGSSPLALIEAGRGAKVLTFVEHSIEDNNE